MSTKSHKRLSVVDKSDSRVSFIGKSDSSVSFIDKYDIPLGSLSFGNIKAIVSKENPMIPAEIKGSVFFKASVALVIFWGVEELFVLQRNSGKRASFRSPTYMKKHARIENFI